MKTKPRLKNFLFTASLLIIFFNCTGAVYTVTTEADLLDNNIGDGLCQTKMANCSLRSAIQESNFSIEHDTIVLAEGTYRLDIIGIDEDKSATGDLDILAAVDIEGVSSTLTFIDGNESDRVFQMFSSGQSDAVRLSHLTIQNGKYSEFRKIGGSAIFTKGQDVELLDVYIYNNKTDGEGAVAVHIDEGCVTGDKVKIMHNVGLSSSTGTIYIEGETACFELNQFEISNNESDSAAAIFLNTSAQVYFNQGLIAYNKSRHSAIITNSDNLLTLENVTISSNESNGTILNDGGSNLFIKNSTITKNIGFNGNIPTVAGIQDVHGGTGLVFLTNSIVAGNGPGFLSDDIHRGNSLNGGNILGDVSNYSSDPTDLLNFDPMLGPLEDLGGYAAAHKPNIITVDLALDEFCLSVDQLNQSRPQDGNNDGFSQCDAGAVELIDDTIFISGFEVN